MNRLLSILIFALISVATAAAKGSPDIEFKTTAHDFGTIREAGGPVTYSFDYVNSGSAPLAIITVSTTCGCTSREFSPKPLAPGKSEKIKVTYDPKGRSGEFTSTVTVRTNIKNPDGSKKKVVLKLSGVIIPKKK